MSGLSKVLKIDGDEVVQRNETLPERYGRLIAAFNIVVEENEKLKASLERANAKINELTEENL